MTIDKAIETFEGILRFVEPGDPPEEHEALKLGIEALKAWQESRRTGLMSRFLLPGETEE